MLTAHELLEGLRKIGVVHVDMSANRGHIEDRKYQRPSATGECPMRLLILLLRLQGGDVNKFPSPGAPSSPDGATNTDKPSPLNIIK